MTTMNEPRTFNYENTETPKDETCDWQEWFLIKSDEEVEQPPERQPGELFYAADGAGDPPVSYDPVLCSFFDGREIGARQADEHEKAEELATAREGLREVLTSFQVGSSAAQEMFSTVNEYINYPRDDAYLEREKAETMAALQKKWGPDTDRMITGAQRVLNEVSRKVPGLADTMVNTGAANNIKIITHLANIAKRRGMT
jgi:hypothetical protein